MADLATLANLAEIVGASTVVGGVAFAAIQLRHLRRQRMDAAAIELANHIADDKFQRYFMTVWALPDGLTAEQLRDRGTDVERAALSVTATFENIGVLVYLRTIHLQTADHLVGGLCRASWRKLRPFVEEERRRVGSATMGEWFQWLAERLEEQGIPGKARGAYTLFREWKA